MKCRNAGSARKNAPLNASFMKRFSVLQSHMIRHLKIGSWLLFVCAGILGSCTVSRQSATCELINDSLLSNGFVGIHLYDIDQKKEVYAHQANRYFTPASTVKLFTAYAAKKILEPKIVGALLFETNDTLFIQPAADPTFLHPDFSEQPLLDAIKKCNKPVVLLETDQTVEPYAPGWAWDDQSEPYMPARSLFPVCGNLLRLEWIRAEQNADFPYMLAVQNTELPNFKINKTYDPNASGCLIEKHAGQNHFDVTLTGNSQTIKQAVPFDPMGLDASMITLRNISYRSVYRRRLKESDLTSLKPLYTQATDSVIRRMLLRSDNFFAEQLLLQCANKSFGQFNDQRMIDSLLHGPLADLPDSPRWVDGSGLSRYNLFTPRSQTCLLKKMIDSFGVAYLKSVLASNGEGTLKTFLSDLSPVVFAKTGTLSNNFCLTGLLTTQKGKRLLFSVMINHVQAKTPYIRKAVELYIRKILEHQ